MRHGSTRAGLTARLIAPALFLMFAGPTSEGRAQAQQAPLPDDRLGIRTAPLLLLSRPDVRADLALTPQQSESAERAITDLYVRAAGVRGKTGAEALAARKSVDDAQRTWIETSLTPDQRTRLLQVDLQWEGPSALVSRPVVADTLTLTEEQRQAIVQAVTLRNAARASGKIPKADDSTLAKTALSLLQPDQRARWHAMLGHPFTPRLAAGGQPIDPVRR